MSKPTVAIVGRPNVGKSTLFNRVVGGRPAIVSDRPGTTRDRHFGDAEWAGRRFWVVDTGGLVPDSDEAMDRAIRRQVEFALEESDVVLFLVDGKTGVHPVDQAIAERLILTLGTVKSYLHILYGKLGVHTRTEALAQARACGLLP